MEGLKNVNIEIIAIAVCLGMLVFYYIGKVDGKTDSQYNIHHTIIEDAYSLCFQNEGLDHIFADKHGFTTVCKNGLERDN